MNKKLLIKFLAILLFSTCYINAQVNIGVNTGGNWIGYMNVFDNTEAQGFLWGNAWGVPEIKTVVDTEANTVTLYPNYNVYGTGDDPAYWTNGEYGNKIMEGNTYIEDNSLLGQTFTFSGEVISNTLIEDYTAIAFIKIMDAGYNNLQLLSASLNAGENFSLASNAADFPDAAFVQYGFSVTGLNGNPAHEEANGNIVIAGSEPNSGAAEITVNAADNWVGYMNVFENDEAQGYLWGEVWGVPDIKTVLDTENNNVILYPNYNVYDTGDDPAYWANGELGNKIMEGNTYVEDNTLIGQTVTFSGGTISNTLIDGYEAIAFIKVLDGSYATLDFVSTPLIAGENFNLVSSTSDFPAAAHVQYGFSVTGLNGNPAHEDANGNVVVGAEVTAGINDLSINKVVVYPNPASNTLHISSESSIDNVTIFNIMGQKVLENQTQNQTAFNISSLANGLYIISAQVEGKSITTRFIKQ